MLSFFNLFIATAAWLLLLVRPSTADIIRHPYDDNRHPLFVCGTEPESENGLILLDAIVQDDGSWTDLRIQVTDASNRLILSFPTKPELTKQDFSFSHSDGDGGYLVNVRFSTAEVEYRLYSLAIPPYFPDENTGEAGGSLAGLQIFTRDGRKTIIKCTDERPTLYIGYMQEAMRCDQSNIYGAAGCEKSHGADRAPGVLPPLDPELLKYLEQDKDKVK